MANGRHRPGRTAKARHCQPSRAPCLPLPPTGARPAQCSLKALASSSYSLSAVFASSSQPGQPTHPWPAYIPVLAHSLRLEAVHHQRRGNGLIPSFIPPNKLHSKAPQPAITPRPPPPTQLHPRVKRTQRARIRTRRMHAVHPSPSRPRTSSRERSSLSSARNMWTPRPPRISTGTRHSSSLLS